MAFLHSDDVYGQNTARLLDLAEFLYAIILQQGGLLVLPPKAELDRMTSGQVLSVHLDEQTGQVILTVVPQDKL